MLLVYLCVRWEEALVSFLFLGNNIFLCPRSNESGSFSRCERVGKTAKKKGRIEKEKRTGRQNKAGLQQCTEDMWVCISMLAATRRHRPSLMKYFCSQSSNRGSSPSTSLALILLSSSNSSRPSGLSSSKSLSLVRSVLLLSLHLFRFRISQFVCVFVCSHTAGHI